MMLAPWNCGARTQKESDKHNAVALAVNLTTEYKNAYF
jgi:hypothetical protein